MAKKLNSVVGIDIGGQSIKIAEIRRQGSENVVTALGMAQTPEGTVDHTGLHDPVAVGDVLKQLCAMAGVSVNDAVVSLSGQNTVMVRVLNDVPVMSDAELKTHMEWEITRSVPFSESTVVSDFQAFPKADAAAQHLDVVMAVATQSSTDALTGMLKRAGKKPAAYDVEALAVARSLDNSYGAAVNGKQVCVIDVGHKTMSINIYKGSHLAMPRQVPIGGEHFTRAIADGLGVSFDEAEVLKTTKADVPSQLATSAFNPFSAGATQQVTSYNPFADPVEPAPADPEPAAEPVADPAPVAVDDEAGKLNGAMAQVLDEFVVEIRRSIDHYKSKGGDVDLVMLCGGGGKLKGLDGFLGASLGVETQLLDPLNNVSLALKKEGAGFDGSNNLDFAVAVGNGLHISY